MKRQQIIMNKINAETNSKLENHQAGIEMREITIKAKRKIIEKRRADRCMIIGSGYFYARVYPAGGIACT